MRSARGRLAWLIGGLAVAGTGGPVLRRLRRASPEAPPPEAADARAEELRRKLAESRELLTEREEFEGGETPVDRAEPAPEGVEEHRRRVHEHGRAAVDELRGGAGSGR